MPPFAPRNFSDLIVYQLHVGTYSLTRPGPYATFLDVVDKIDYLAALGVNVLQPLPIDEAETSPSLGYMGRTISRPISLTSCTTGMLCRGTSNASTSFLLAQAMRRSPLRISRAGRIS